MLHTMLLSLALSGAPDAPAGPTTPMLAALAVDVDALGAGLIRFEERLSLAARRNAACFARRSTPADRSHCPEFALAGATAGGAGRALTQRLLTRSSSPGACVTSGACRRPGVGVSGARSGTDRGHDRNGNRSRLR